MTDKEKFYQLANNITYFKGGLKWARYFQDQLEEVTLILLDNTKLRYRNLEPGFESQCLIKLFLDKSYLDPKTYSYVIREKIIEECYFNDPHEIDKILGFISQLEDKEIVEQLLQEIEMEKVNETKN